MVAKLTTQQRIQRRRAALEARRDRDAAAMAGEVTRDVLALLEAADMGDTEELAATRRYALTARKQTAKERARGRNQTAAALAAKRKSWTMWGGLGVAAILGLMALRKKK